MSSEPEPSRLSLAPEEVPKGLVVETRQPQPVPFGEESLEFHAARLLFLLRFAGGTKHRITGRTKIAKLDFFVRYPTYLVKAARLKQIDTNVVAEGRPESAMIRYKYGPWDDKYYNIFALLVARGFVQIYPSDKGDVFELTDRGRIAVEELNSVDFEEIVQRCQLVSKLFGTQPGTIIKEFIYENFPEIVAKSLGTEID
jgi:hypothetical protein